MTNAREKEKCRTVSERLRMLGRGLQLNKEMWVAFIGKVPWRKYLKTLDLIMWISGKENSRHRRHRGAMIEGTPRGQSG